MDPAKMQALTEQLRRREALATIGQLSGDPVLGQFGQGEMKRISGRRKSMQEALEAAQKRKDARPSGMPGYVLREGQVEPVPEYLNWQAGQKAADRKTRLQIARERGQGGGGDWYARDAHRRQFMNPTEWNKVSESLGWIEQLGRTIPEVAGAKDEDIAWPTADIGAEMASNMGLSGVARAIEPIYRSDDARSTRTKIKKIINSVRASEFGAALTAMEKPEFAAVDPLAPGLSKDAMLRRLKDLVDGLVTTARIRIGGRTGPSGEAMPAYLQQGYDWNTGGMIQAGGQAPAPQMTPGQVPPIPETGPGATVGPGQIPHGSVAPSQRTPETMEQPPMPAPPEIAPGEWEKLSPEAKQWYLQNRGEAGGA